MFLPGDSIVHVPTGDRATFRSVYSSPWPDILAVADWPKSDAEVMPGVRGRLYRECALLAGPKHWRNAT